MIVFIVTLSLVLSFVIFAFAIGFKKGRLNKEKTKEGKKLKEFLTILIGDLSEELHDLIEAQNDAEKQATIRNYF